MDTTNKLAEAVSYLIRQLDDCLHENDYCGLQVSKHDRTAVDDAIEAVRQALTTPSADQATQPAEAVAWLRADKYGNLDVVDSDVHGAFPVCRCATHPAPASASEPAKDAALKHAMEALKEAEFVLHKVYTDHGIVQVDGEDGAWIFVSKAADRMDAAIDVVKAAIECYDCGEVSCVCDDICNGRITK